MPILLTIVNGFQMKNILILIILSIFKMHSYGQKNDSSVLFKENIGWQLFKGIPNNDTTGARISTSINLEIDKINVLNGLIHFKAYAIMRPYDSWVKSGYADNYTLQHEQTHFNITEWCARRLQAELNRMRIKKKKSPAIQGALTKWQKTMEDLQIQYDHETMGGNNALEQDEWNNKIVAELSVSA